MSMVALWAEPLMSWKTCSYGDGPGPTRAPVTIGRYRNPLIPRLKAMNMHRKAITWCVQLVLESRLGCRRAVSWYHVGIRGKRCEPFGMQFPGKAYRQLSDKRGEAKVWKGLKYMLGRSAWCMHSSTSCLCCMDKFPVTYHNGSHQPLHNSISVQFAA